VLEDAAIIRIWGTTEGLGQLAYKGPIEGSTILDPEPEGTKLRVTACERIIPCDEIAWDKWRPSETKTINR
jgi:hypothetical protein